MKTVVNNFRIGAIYYNEDKQCYMLITQKTKKRIAGYSTKYEKPTTRDRFNGLHTEKIGTVDFGGLHIAIGNIFDQDITDENFPKLTYVRSLERWEFRAFKTIIQYVIDKKLVYKSDNGHIKAIR